MSLSRRKITTTRAQIPQAIRTLRENLGESQEAMARKVGCTLAAYQSWELGRRSPRGEWLLKLLALCPDDETRALFGLTPSESHADTPSGKMRFRKSEGDPQIVMAREMAHNAVEILFELACGGSRAAAEQLGAFADRLSKRAGDLSRAGPRQKD